MPIDVLTAGATGVGLAGSWWTARALFHRAILRGLRAPRVPHALPLTERPLAVGRWEALRLEGSSGRRLAAWMAWPAPGTGEERAPAVLVMHGWGANASAMWEVVPPLLQAGMAVLLLDARCHGDSDDEPFTSLPRFAEDIGTGLAWLRRHARVDAARLALLGHSVGAAAALLHAARAAASPHAGTPRAVVSLSAFAHPQEVMRRFLAAHGVPAAVIGTAVIRHVQRVIGARFDDIAPVHTIRHVTCPVLLVHGRDDATVPLDDARRLQRAGDAELLIVAGGHDLRATLAPHAHEIVDFLWRHLREADACACMPSPER